MKPSQTAWLMGHYLDRGIRPEHIQSLTREEKLFYIAAAELNNEQRSIELEIIIQNAVIKAFNIINGGRADV